MLDYETLRLIWWLLLGVLLIGFAIMDGFDLGSAFLLPIVARTDIERRVVINTVGPVWEGNQVWFILGGGAIFAAWPPLYAVSFSGFYIAMILTLGALILRPVGFKFRSKLEHTRWRSAWDTALFIGGLVPSIVFGVAVGNLLLGVPFRFDSSMRASFEFGFFDLLSPFGLVCGLLSLSMIATQGGSWLSVKTDGTVQARARKAAMIAAAVAILLFAVGGLWVARLQGFVITSVIDPSLPSDPLAKTVTREAGAWLGNYGRYPWMAIAPILGFAGIALALLMAWVRKPIAGFLASSIGILGIISTAGLSLFPFLMPSSSDPASSLTVWDASSSQLTLTVMLIAAAIFLPIILAYTAWVYRVMRGKVSGEHVENSDSAY
ncbi:cytochrome d ubiquinol oxidase subunit II [Hypericibacter sp.]|uniref:cytochrome d ubiquinol oxidase subunit II n=1 Tax=Hypericibacter sp. TaxID=2705401 RepID=UPI003D6D8A01